ncbi:MAG: hypothetical protein IJ317_03295, partial [Clostridia bacterium]|nr:hypothetical protein [Clostridia bacterium]
KAFSNNYVFNSSRTRAVDGTTVKCWSNHANGKHCNQTLAEALNNSCNIADKIIGTENNNIFLSSLPFKKSTLFFVCVAIYRTPLPAICLQ